MNPTIAAICCAVGVCALLLMTRHRSVKPSLSLLLPTIWLSIGASRGISSWLQLSGPSNYSDQYLEGNSLDRYGLSLLIALAIIALVPRAARVRRVLRANWPTVAFFCYCLFSLAWSDYPVVGAKRWFRSFGDLTMILIILTEDDWREAFGTISTRVAFLLLPISVLFIKYYPALGRAYGNDGTLYWTGVAGGKNGLGLLCLVFVLGCLWNGMRLFFGQRRLRHVPTLIAYAVVVSTGCWLLAISDSKTSQMCFALVGGVMVATAASSTCRKPLVLHSLIAGSITLSFAVLFVGVGSGFLEALGRDSTLTGRTDIWRDALQFVQNPIFGAGFETFWLGDRLERITRTLGVGLNQAHNGYLEVYLNLGWIGVGLLVIIIVTSYRNIMHRFARDPETSVLQVAFFMIAVIYNFTEGTFKIMSPVWIFFLMSTMAAARARVTDVSNQEMARSSSDAIGGNNATVARVRLRTISLESAGQASGQFERLSERPIKRSKWANRRPMRTGSDSYLAPSMAASDGRSLTVHSATETGNMADTAARADGILPGSKS